MSRSIYSFRPLISRSGDQPGEDLAASTLGFRPVPEQDPEHSTLLLGTSFRGEREETQAILQKGLRRYPVLPHVDRVLEQGGWVYSGWRRRRAVSQTTLIGAFAHTHPPFYSPCRFCPVVSSGDRPTHRSSILAI